MRLAGVLKPGIKGLAENPGPLDLLSCTLGIVSRGFFFGQTGPAGPAKARKNRRPVARTPAT